MVELSSTIVEIIMALQPTKNVVCDGLTIYDSRNYYGIIAVDIETKKQELIYDSRNYYGIIAAVGSWSEVRTSTIVEIIMALQPAPLAISSVYHLRQQKLLWHYSQQDRQFCQRIIYDSRNYYGIIAQVQTSQQVQQNLRQQKLLWHYSLKSFPC